MRALRRPYAAGLIATLSLTAFAAWPLLTRPGLPTATDAELHIYRTEEVRRAWAAGQLYPRWAPDLAFGYGYPVFNYYAPLAYYLGAAYGLLGGDATAGVKFVLVAALALGALGMYGFMREIGDGPGALTAAAAFTLAPYVMHLNPIARGAAPEALAVGLSPGVFWAFTRLQRAPSPARLAGAAFALAALGLAHNLLAAVFTGALLGWLLWNWIKARQAGRWLAGALAAGLGLSAFFWLPAGLEREAVQFQRAFAYVQDPRNALRLVPAAELLAPGQAADLAEPAAADWRFRLGLPQWLLAGAGVLAALRRRAEGPWLYFALLAAALIGLMLPAAEPLWRAGLGLLYLQLPWRLLGPAAFALAVLAGGGVQLLGPRLPAAPAAGLAAAACALAAWPLLNPLPWAPFGPVTTERLRVFESGGNIGTTAQNEFLPAAVTAMPGPPADLADKVGRTSLPAGATVDLAAAGLTEWRGRAAGPAAFTLTLLIFDFPGWRAEVDGAPASLTPSSPNGFITLALPAGEHTFTVRFADTPPRTLGWLISLGTLVGLGAGLVWRRRPAPAAPAPAGGLSGRLALGVAAGLALLLAVHTILGGRLSPAPPPAAALARLEGQLALLDARLAEASVRAGAAVPLTLTWAATGPVLADYSVFVHVLDAQGQVWGQSDKLNPLAEFPTSRWPAGRPMPDLHTLALKPDTPPGVYTVRAGLWERLSGRRLRVLGPDGRPTDADSVNLEMALRVTP